MCALSSKSPESPEAKDELLTFCNGLSGGERTTPQTCDIQQSELDRRVTARRLLQRKLEKKGLENLGGLRWAYIDVNTWNFKRRRGGTLPIHEIEMLPL